MKKILVISAFCSSLLLASSEVDELKMQLQKQSDMIEALNKRLDEMQDNSHFTPTQDAAEYAEEDVPAFTKENIPVFEENTLGVSVNATSSFAQPQNVPNISLVIDTSLALRNKSQDDLNHLSMPGIMESPFASNDGHGHSAASGENGFNFNYAELVFNSNIDPFFSMDATFHFSEDSVEIEEAYFTTTALEGIRIKGGKFLSDFGRLNKQHQHIWSFSDAPLIYAGFLGNDGLNEVGAQFQYTLPTDTYVMLGTEILQGKNETSFGNQSLEFNAQEIEGSSAPSMVVAYVKNSFDLGNTTILPGVSYVYGNSISSDEHDGHALAFSGHTDIYNLELTVKHYFDSYSFFAWQSEWMRREQDGTAYEVHLGVTENEDQKIRQEGLYSQVIYGLNQNWRTGIRYDSIYKNDIAFVNEDGDTLPSTPYSRYSVMAEYYFSEFSRLRLQYNLNKGLYSGDVHDGFSQEDVHELLLSFTFAIGAHTAHDF